MLGDQEEFISELYDKNGRYLSCWLILYAPKTGWYHPKNIIQTFSENLTKNKRGVSNGCVPQRIYFFRPGSYSPRLIGYPGRGKEITNKDIVKGFEYDKDKHVIVTGDDFEKIKAEKDRPIQILHFNDLSSIHPHLLR